MQWFGAVYCLALIRYTADPVINVICDAELIAYIRETITRKTR